MLEGYTADARTLVVFAQALADERGHHQVEPLHLLVRALSHGSGVAQVFLEAGRDPSAIAAAAERELMLLAARPAQQAYLSGRMIDLLERASREARGGPVGVEHLLNVLVQELRGPLAGVLERFELGPGSLRWHVDVLGGPPVVPGDVEEPERGLLDAIGSRDDLEARAVYADWLEERGRALEAGMVRTTIQIRSLAEGKRAPLTPSMATLRSRLQEGAASVPRWWRRIVAPAKPYLAG